MAHSYFSISLPSKGRLYSDGESPDVKVRAFTGAEEAILAEMNERNASEKIVEVLDRCIQGVDIRELTLGDKLYLMVWHAINSYSDGFQTTITCQHCLQDVQVGYNLADLETTYLSDKYTEPYPVKVSSGAIVNCRLLRVKDEKAIEKIEKSTSSSFLYQVATYIVDTSKDIVEKAKMLEEMPSKDLAKLRAFQDSFYHGPDFNTWYTCPKCDGRGLFTAPFRFEHFFPYGDSLTKNFGIKV